MLETDLVADTAGSVHFLREIHVERPMTLVAIKEGLSPGAQTFDVNVGDEVIAAWITEHNLNGGNIYWQVNPAVDAARNNKARKQDIIGVVMLHVDVDDPSNVALERLKAFEPRPSVILFSGGGYQAFWLLNEPLADIPKAEALNRQIASKLGGDNCHNADRIMRVPGTINWPNAKKQKAGRKPVLSYVL